MLLISKPEVLKISSIGAGTKEAWGFASFLGERIEEGGSKKQQRWQNGIPIWREDAEDQIAQTVPSLRHRQILP
jgi:hypothetical protein